MIVHGNLFSVRQKLNGHFAQVMLLIINSIYIFPMKLNFTCESPHINETYISVDHCTIVLIEQRPLDKQYSQKKMESADS